MAREIIEVQVFSSLQEQSDYYRQLDEQLTMLLVAMAERMEPNRLQQPREFVELGEYGLALEALCESIGENRVGLPTAAYAAIEFLGRTMGLESTTWEPLRPLVVPEAPSSPASTQQS